MKTTHVVASELFLVFLLAGCANLPMDQDCHTGLENEFKVWDTNGRALRYHRSSDFSFHLSAAADDALVGDYQSCLNNLRLARVHRHGPAVSSDHYYRTRNTNSWSGQNQSNSGASIDAAHHAAGHTHHHGH